MIDRGMKRKFASILFVVAFAMTMFSPMLFPSQPGSIDQPRNDIAGGISNGNIRSSAALTVLEGIEDVSFTAGGLSPAYWPYVLSTNIYISGITSDGTTQSVHVDQDKDTIDFTGRQYNVATGSLTVAGSLSVSVDVGTWKKDGAPLESTKDYGGSYVAIATATGSSYKPQTTVPYTPPFGSTTTAFSNHPNTVWYDSQDTAGDHSYAIPDTAFDGKYDTNPGSTGSGYYYGKIYLHVYLYFKSTSILNEIGYKVRRVASITITFSDSKSVGSALIPFTLTKNPGATSNTIDNYKHVTSDVYLGAKYHSVSFSSLSTSTTSDGETFSSNYLISTKDGATAKHTNVDLAGQGYFPGFYFDDVGTTYDFRSKSLGIDYIKLKSDAWLQTKVSHTTTGHTYTYTIVEPAGTSSVIPINTVIETSDSTNGEITFFGPEDFTIGGATGAVVNDISELISNVRSVYSITTNFDGTIAYKKTGATKIIPIFTFLNQKNAPYTITITFTRLLGSISALTIADMGITPPVLSGSTLTISWNNLLPLTRIKYTLSDFSNPNYVGYKIQSSDAGVTVAGASVSNFQVFDVETQFPSPIIQAAFDVPTPTPFLTFTLTVVYGVETTKFSTTTGAILGSPIETRSFPIYYDGSVLQPSGSFGSVFFESDDLIISSGSIKDGDGEFFLKASVSGWSNTDGYKVIMYGVPGTSIDPTSGNNVLATTEVDFTGSVFSISSSFINGGTRLGAGKYQFVIVPYKKISGVAQAAPINPVSPKTTTTDTVYGNDVSEIAVGSSSWVLIQVVDLQNPDMKVTLDGNLGTVQPTAGNALTSENGILNMIFNNYNAQVDQLLTSADPLFIEQYVGGVKRYEIHGFDDYPSTNSFRLFDDAGLYNTRIYTSVPTRFLDIRGGDFNPTIGQRNYIGFESANGIIRGLDDGIYRYRGKFNYVSYGATTSLNDITITVASARSLTADGDTGSITSYSGEFTLHWNPMGNNPNDLIEDEKIFYVVLFGKASDGINPSSFTNDLSTISSNIHILQQNGTDQLGSEVWRDRIFDRIDTTIVIDESCGNDGASAFNIPIGSSQTFYFAVLPFYKVQVDREFDLFWWYHGDVSNVVEVVVDRQAFTAVSVSPSAIVGGNRVIYTQGDATFEALGLTGGVAVADSATITVNTYTDLTRTTLFSTHTVLMDDMGSGRFESTINIFDDLTIDSPVKYASVLVEYDYTTAGIGTGVRIENRQIVFNTGVQSSINYITPSQGGVVAPSSDPSAEILFNVNIHTNPALASAYNLPQFAVDEGDVSIVSATIEGKGAISGYGTVQSIPGTLNWNITLNNLFNLPAGILKINILARVTTDTLVLEVPATLTYNLRYDPSIVIFSPSAQNGETVTVTGYSTKSIKWLSFYGSDLVPDSVDLTVKKNGASFFSGTVAPIGFYYQYVINPLQHDDGDTFSFEITTRKGTSATASFSFAIVLDFQIVIPVDLGDFEYDSSNPPVNGDVEAYIPVQYPVSYDLFYLETGQIIFNPERYRLVRDLGNGTIIEFVPENIGTSTQLVFNMVNRPAIAGSVDKLVFDIPAPITTKKGFSFPEENLGTLYIENITVTSQYRFTDLTVTITPSAVFDFQTDEVWNVTVNGVQVTVIVTPARDLRFNVTAINPGQVINVQIIHYYESEVVFPEEPEPEPEPTLFDQIIQMIIGFITAIVAFVLSLIGIARIRRIKGSNSLNIPNI